MENVTPEYKECIIEGRNAVIEAFRSGREIDRVYILDGCKDGPILTVKSRPQRKTLRSGM